VGFSLDHGFCELPLSFSSGTILPDDSDSENYDPEIIQPEEKNFS
jgi:hypothetical protein